MKSQKVKKPCRRRNSSRRKPTISTPTVDRISDLPDSILCHILSFIPTKQVVATSLLSPRWKSIWLSVLTLDLEDKTFKDFTSFQNFTFIAIFSRNITLPILSFRFKCSNNNSLDFDFVDNFASFVMQRGIENLNISTSTKLPSSILNCKTLKVLELENLRVEDFSHQMDLPLLETLHLNEVDFEHHEYLVKFLSSCPILDDLQLKCIRIPDFLVGKENFKSLPSLKSLYVEFV
ncbi:unnamed protein product [Trifolium pratense]|uniref:Uncharacterized protein n=1 Tax=Trifolium pratense TaxID=57577 RepID=A0ACB0L8K1_TRIPR|nr:unnamed protein product [Trifolium pratense]